MKKVLIISYFAPPCQLTSANRIGSWMEYLPENGYKPILVTRKWTGKEMTAEDRLDSSEGHLEEEIGDNYQKFKLPYKQSLRDKFYSKRQQLLIFAWLSKMLTFINLVLVNFTPRASAFYNLYTFSRDLLRKDQSIDLLIISGNPFEQFYFGYLLKKEFPKIQWVADYRDEWNTSLIYQNSRINIPWLSALEKKSERRWVGSAAAIQTVCPYFTQGLSQLHQRIIHVVPNGFDSTFEQFLDEDLRAGDGERLHLLFGGTLFPNQSIDMLLEALSNLTKDQVCVEFVGSKLDYNNARITDLIEKGVLKHTSWIPKEEMINRMKGCDGFLMFPFKDMKGWPSSKIYDYLPFRKPVFLIPSDYDIIEDILKSTELGILCNSSEAFVEAIQLCIERKKQGERLLSLTNKERILPYSRRAAARKFADILTELAHNEG